VDKNYRELIIEVTIGISPSQLTSQNLNNPETLLFYTLNFGYIQSKNEQAICANQVAAMCSQKETFMSTRTIMHRRTDEIEYFLMNQLIIENMHASFLLKIRIGASV